MYQSLLKEVSMQSDLYRFKHRGDYYSNYKEKVIEYNSKPTLRYFMGNEVSSYNRLFQQYKDETRSISANESAIALKAVQTTNTPLYATIAQIAGLSDEVVNTVHTLILDEVMYILFLDRLYESRNTEDEEMAQACHSRVLSNLTKEQVRQLSEIEKKLFVFWEIEKGLRQRMEGNGQISKEEIQSFIRRKSSDAFIYSTILQFFADVPKEVILELYSHQLLRDVEDDERDLEEDSQENMPNPLLLRLYNEGKYTCNRSYSQQELEVMCVDAGIIEKHRSIVHGYCRKLSSRLPIKYQWMSDCSGVKQA